jgi:hypothetical protein
MIEGWWPTHSLSLASCLGALGFPIRTDVVLDERSGEEVTTFYVGLRSLWNSMATDALINDWHSGRLEQADPLHPFLCGLRACHNANTIASSLRNEDRIRLTLTADDHVMIYDDGDELPSLRDADELIETTDAGLVAALGVIGIPMIEHDNGLFRLPRFGHSVKALSGEWMRYDAQALIQQLRENRLERDEPQHPLISAYNARCVQNQIVAHLHSTGRRVLLRKPRSLRSAFVSEQASDDMLDRVQRHFRIA